jgi:predicted AlkP superfamily phosphohydrolase/phosphomutase
MKAMKKPKEKRDRKVLVIGLDAATFDIIDPLIQKGKLPNINKLMKNGVRGDLRTTIPPLSPNAWTSFATGKNAGKHGIYSFTEQKSSSYGIRFVNARSRKARPIWSILSEIGKKVGVINMPITYPPDDVDGFMISGMDSPGRKADFTFPSELKDVLLKNFDYEIDYSFLGTDLKRKGKKILNKLYDVEKKRVDAARYLMDAYDWDFCFIVLVALDRVQHFFWHCMEPSHPRYREKGAEKFRKSVFEMYERMDGLVGNLLQKVDEKTSIFLMSDHGAGPFEEAVPYLNLNDWLCEEGYLGLKKQEPTGKNMMMGLREFFRKTLPSGAKQWLKTKFPALRESFQSHVYFSMIDWSGTKAYAAYDEFMARGIRVNLMGREPEGVVTQGEEYELLRDELIDRIRVFKHPVTDEPVVAQVYKREELYSGDYLHKAPDIVVEWNEKAFFCGKNSEGMIHSTKKEKFKLTAIPRSGEHRSKGILVAYGPFIAEAKYVSGIHIMDFAPTVLYLLEQPVPEDMDGQVMFQIFDDSFVKKNPVHYKKVTKKEKVVVEETYTEEEAKIIEKKLRKLGYID